MIESYSFGRITIDGKNYTTDVIIYPSHVADGWWRKEGHRLCVEDLKDALQSKPEVIVVGTGYFGSMKVPNEVKEHLASNGIELIAENTREAYKTYNRLASAEKVAAAFHLTC